ncbi:MAG: methionyl-tRNA formyltransferase [Phycisphaerae bacterium]
MRIVFCGSGSFAAPTLRAIIRAGHDVVKIVTQPPRPSGRGGKVHRTPLDEAARAEDVLKQDPGRICECQNVNSPEAVAAIRDAKPDVICVADFGQFIRQPVRQLAPMGAFNLHGSLLPELRGAAPINWAIIRGYPRTGVTTFSLVDKMDAGAMYLQDSTDIRPDETAEELRARLAEIGAGVVCRTLEMLARGPVTGQAQNESRVTLAPMLKKSDGLIDWSAEAAAIRNLIHGVWPWPGGQAIFRRAGGPDTPVIVARAAVEPDSESPRAMGPRAEPGTLDADLLVVTGRGRLRIVEIQPAGKRVMTWKDFVNGHRPKAGDRFVRPSQ